MVAADAHTPLEKTFRPFFSWTIQWSPEAFTRRVRAASPGDSSTQQSGTVRTRPSAVRTVFGVGPGPNVRGVILLESPCNHSSEKQIRKPKVLPRSFWLAKR